MQRVHNQTVDDEEIETNIEGSTMTGSNTDDTSTKTIADGGTEEIRNYDEVRHSRDDVRDYSADGHLYAYREDDDHIVVSRGNKPRTRWTKRVPAERDAVLVGENIWTIPENWQHRLNIKGTAEARYRVYHIPETGVDVLVSVPYKNQLIDAWYNIRRVGTLSVTYDDEFAWDELGATINYLNDSDEVSDDVVEALETLYHHPLSFERKYGEEVNTYAKDALLDPAHEPVTVEQWTTDPWVDRFQVDSLVQDFLDIDDETRDAVVDKLSESNALPSYPTVRVDVEDDERLPEGYVIRALVEAGLSGAEAIDYLITAHYHLVPQSEWAEIRGTSLSVIRENVSVAQMQLSD